MTSTVSGRVWKFGDNINTDLMVPGFALNMSTEQQLEHLFEANRPGWVSQVNKGEILVTGENFGTGSSRPGAQVLRRAGIAALVCESINGLFLRNAVNSGLYAMSCPGVLDLFEEGDVAVIDFAKGEVRNTRSGATVIGKALPTMLLDILDAGGVVPLLRAEGLLPQRQPRS